MLPERAENGLDPTTGIVLAIALHVGAFFAMGWIDPAEPPPPDLIEFEIATAPPEPEPPEPPEPPKPPEPEVTPEPPEPEVTPEPEVKPPEPEPPKKPPPRQPKPPPSNDPPPADDNPDPAPAPKRFDLPASALVPSTGGGVNVTPGTGGASSGSNAGSPGGSGTRPGTGNNPTGTGPKPAGPSWAPRGDLYIAQQPRVVRVPELECPAVAERQVAGTVVLLVQVQRDGKVRSAKPTKKMGFGCDEIARKALMGAKFAPAVGTDGKTADYELRYEYVFELRD